MKILLVDDHHLLREGMRLLLRSFDSDLEVDDAANCAQALELVAERSFDLILLDLKMPGLNGLDALAALRNAAAHMPIVVVSGEADPRVIRAAIDGGAMGFVPKSSSPGVMIQALRLVLAHGVYLPPQALEPAYAAPASTAPRETKLAGLTPRQMDVLRCVIRGKPNKVIAGELALSEGTVKAHLSAVFHALGVHNRTEAVYAAATMGLQIG
jgi:DNA-binding NarL/FixJ family response regulator